MPALQLLCKKKKNKKKSISARRALFTFLGSNECAIVIPMKSERERERSGEKIICVRKQATDAGRYFSMKIPTHDAQGNKVNDV